MNSPKLDNRRNLGRFAANLFARQTGRDQTVMIGGLGDDEIDWEYVLTRRASLALWYDLTRLLFPEKSDEVIGQVSTMRSLPRIAVPGMDVTSAVFVTAVDEGGCQLEGWNGETGWVLRLDAYEIYRFWAALDTALYPTGW